MLGKTTNPNFDHYITKLFTHVHLSTCLEISIIYKMKYSIMYSNSCFIIEDSVINGRTNLL